MCECVCVCARVRAHDSAFACAYIGVWRSGMGGDGGMVDRRTGMGD